MLHHCYPVPLTLVHMGDDANDCSSLEYACATIQAGVNAVAPDGKVSVRGGTYTGPTIIVKSLSLSCEMGVGDEESATYKGDLTIGARNVLIDGFTFTDFGGITITGAQTDIHINNNAFIGPGVTGLAGGGSTVDATLNWWGCNSGPNTGGCSNTTGGGVDSSPILNDSDLGVTFCSIVAKPGEASGDLVVDIIDARVCQQILVGLLPGYLAQLKACDVNNNGDIDDGDINQIAQFSIELIGTLASAGSVIGLFGILLAFPVLLTRRRSSRVRWLVMALLIGTLGMASGCSLFPPGTSALYALVSDNFITISVQNMPGGGLAAFAASNGGFSFDPNVISVDSIQVLGGFDLLASQIDNFNGEVNWGITNTFDSLVSGVVLLKKISVKVSSFSPDLSGVQWQRGKLTLGDDTNTEISPAQYKVFPLN